MATSPAVQNETADLCLGSTNPKKVVHHRRCPHARTDYLWARQHDTLADVAEALVESGAWRWHRCCQACCGDLDDAVLRALKAAGVFNQYVSRWP